MAAQCNQSQYLTLLEQICVHTPSARQASQANLSNSLTSKYPPDPGDHALKKSAADIGEGFPGEMVEVYLPKFQAKDDRNFNSYKCPCGISTHCLHESPMDHQPQ